MYNEVYTYFLFLFSDYSYANGDISSDRSDAGVFSPTSDSPFQPEFAHLPDNHIPLNTADNNANITASKLDDTQGRQVIDSQGSFSADVPPVSTFGTDTVVPMTGVTHTDNGAPGQF